MNTTIVSGQEWSTDTLFWSNKLFITELPNNFQRLVDNYTEGVFISYTFPDSSYFTIFYGSMATVSLFRQEEFDTLSIDFNTYFGQIGKTEKYWKSRIKSEKFMWWYNMVSEEQLQLFDKIFESFHVETIRGGGG